MGEFVQDTKELWQRDNRLYFKMLLGSSILMTNYIATWTLEESQAMYDRHVAKNKLNTYSQIIEA